MTTGLHAALEATWPAVRAFAAGSWTIRDGGGGGKRVSAATARPGWAESDIPLADREMRGLGQTPLFMIRSGDETLDEALARRGYRAVDETLFYAAPITDFAPCPEPMAVFPHWPPLAIVRAIWADAGIGAARQAVMARVAGPHAALLARSGDRPSGAAFAAVEGATAMLHALEVPEDRRRRGAARNILRRAAFWAGENGATHLALAVTARNAPARALYESLGMAQAGQYHYRLA